MRSLKKNSAAQAMAMAAVIMPDARPPSEAAKATMQTNSGAGLGKAVKKRSTRVGIKAVAAVRAGPKNARPSDCLPVFFCPRGEGLPVGPRLQTRRGVFA